MPLSPRESSKRLTRLISSFFALVRDRICHISTQEKRAGWFEEALRSVGSLISPLGFSHRCPLRPAGKNKPEQARSCSHAAASLPRSRRSGDCSGCKLLFRQRLSYANSSNTFRPALASKQCRYLPWGFKNTKNESKHQGVVGRLGETRCTR